MYCTSCGQETPENSTFCLHCGSRIAVPSAPNVSIQWEHKDFVYNFLPPGQGLWAKLGPGAYSEAGAKLEFWQNSQREISAELRQWIDNGWEPIGEVGSSCVEITTGYSHRDKSSFYWIWMLLFSIPSFGLVFIIALLARSNIAEPVRFVLRMRRAVQIRQDSLDKSKVYSRRLQEKTHGEIVQEKDKEIDKEKQQRNCSVCGSAVPKGINRCPHCGWWEM